MKEKIERIELKDIKDPNIVKKLGYRSLTILCHDIRKEIIAKTSVYGGHLASNLGTVELTVALYRTFDFPKDKLIFDVGHQCYTHKILTGRSLDHLRQKNGPSGFERRNESVYDCYEAGHSSTSLSAAEGFAIARDLKNEDYNIVAVIGDSSIVNGLSFEALNNIGSRKDKIIVVLNDNDMSISRPVGGLGNFFRKISTARLYNKFKSSYRRALYRTHVGRGLYAFSYYLKTNVKAALVPTTMFDNMGFTYIGPVDGHNIASLEKAFTEAKNTTKSAVVHVYTQKGRGYPPAEKDTNGYWHGVSPFEIETGEPLIQHPGWISWSHLMGDMTHEALKKNPNTILICPAMIKGSHMENCFFDYPERCFDVGISEEHAVTMAGALSLNDYHPILCIYSTFLQRAYDEILHDCCRMGTDLTLLIDRAGLVGPDGSTHMGIYDEAYLKSIPNLTLAMPSSLAEAKILYATSLEKGHGVFAIRYPHCLTNQLAAVPNLSLPYGSWRFITPIKAGKPAVVAVGPNGLSLMDKLGEAKFDGALINPLYLNPLLEENVKAILPCSEVFIYDSYGTIHGFAESLAAALAVHHYQGYVHVRAIPNDFVHHASVADQEKDCHVSVDEAFHEILESSVK
jgi:1-deoxy-D-xylulose-5-phosphate synthase